MEKIDYFTDFPNNLTYPDITKTLLPHLRNNENIKKENCVFWEFVEKLVNEIVIDRKKE
jgi:hypothetical protein